MAAKEQPAITEEIVPILILVAVIAFVVSRLPKVDVGHTAEFRRRRVLNWLPLGLTYAFLYMARYNINTLKDAQIITQAEFGHIDFVGAVTYGCSFLINGPLTDRFGGRRTILVAAGGAIAANVALGLLMVSGRPAVGVLAAVYAVNMYFQSFGAVSIVKVNASWFHLRERGTFGGIFGILISLGLYFAFDWGARIMAAASTTSYATKLVEVGPIDFLFQVPSTTYAPEWVFFVPAAILAVFWFLSWKFVFDTPRQAGLADFDVADASSGQSDAPESAIQVIKRLLSNKIILIIAIIELCSGFLRQGILKWYRDFATGIGEKGSYVYEHWGMVSCIAGITGGLFAGLISDHVFQSRRAPVSSVLYGIMLGGAILIIPLFSAPWMVSWVIAFMAMAIIGVHGMLSGVASQDFGGRKNAGVATGLIDGFVYLGTAAQALVYGNALPEKGTPAAKDISNWYAWPGAMIPVALLGLVLAAKLWNARVKPKTSVEPAADLVAPEKK